MATSSIQLEMLESTPLEREFNVLVMQPVRVLKCLLSSCFYTYLQLPFREVAQGILGDEFKKTRPESLKLRTGPTMYPPLYHPPMAYK